MPHALHIAEPPLVPMTPDTLGGKLLVGDVLLCGMQTRFTGPTIQWGQRLMLQRFGYARETAVALSRFVHTVTVTDPERLLGIEATLPSIRYTDIAKDYGTVELLVLRGEPLDEARRTKLQLEAVRYHGVAYDWRQYITYPFYMSYGWVSSKWADFWDDPDKPVCSGLSIRLLQATGQLKRITVHREYPPARLPTLPELTMVMRTRLIAQPVRASQAARRAWWMAR